MARFLLTIWPYVGHVYPFLSVAEALRSRGHEVAFYTGERARSLLKHEGFGLFPLRNVDENRIWDLVIEMERGSPVDRQSLRLKQRIFRELLVETIPDQVTDLQSIIADWSPDVVVTETMVWGPTVVLRETLGLRVALLSTLMGCQIPGPDAPPPGLGLPPPRTLKTRLTARAATFVTDLVAAGLRRRVDQIRAGYGLPALGCSVNASTARLPLCIIPSLPELDYNRGDLPHTVHYVGPCVRNKPSEEPSPTWLDELPGDRPIVHVTEGTAHYQDPFVLRAAARGLANLPIEAILTTGPQRDPAELGLGQ